MGKLEGRLRKLEKRQANKVIDIRVVDVRKLSPDAAQYRIAELEKRIAKQPGGPIVVIDV